MNISQYFKNPVMYGAIFLLLTPMVSQSATIVVSEGESIAAALAMSADGDSVLVASGEYRETGMEMPSGVTLAALDDQAQPRLIGDDGASILHCEDLSIATKIDGLIFQGEISGDAPFPMRGQGLHIINSAMTISDCSFLDLKASYGGAIYVGKGLAPYITGCRFESNTAEGSGGAVSLIEGEGLVLDHCLFKSNTAASGGVLIVAWDASASMNHCTLVDNGSYGSGDIQVWDSTLAEISNCIIYGSEGRAFYGDYAGTPSIQCSDLTGNAGGDWMGAIADQAEMSGNISEDPLFCGSEGEVGPYSLNEDSSCIADCGIMGAFEIGCDSSAGVDGTQYAQIDEDSLPAVTQLRGNFPNPFNPQTTIAFDLSQTGHAAVDVYDLAGRLVRNLHSGVLAAGPHQVMWNGRGPDGRMSAAGIYFFRLKTELVTDTQRMMLVK